MGRSVNLPRIMSIDLRLKQGKYKAKLQAMKKGYKGARVTVPAPIMHELNMKKGQWVLVTIKPIVEPKKSSWEEVPSAKGALAAVSVPPHTLYREKGRKKALAAVEYKE